MCEFQFGAAERGLAQTRPNNNMVLADLGRKINNALSQLSQAPIIDEQVRSTSSSAPIDLGVGTYVLVLVLLASVLVYVLRVSMGCGLSRSSMRY